MGQLKGNNGTAWVDILPSLPDYNTFQMNVPLSGTVNGTNKVFTSPYEFTSIAVYKNGVRMTPGVSNDYTVTGATQVTFTTAPTVPTVFTADLTTTSSFAINGTNSFVAKQAVTGLVNGVNATFTTSSPYLPGSLNVYVNGLKQAVSMVNESNYGIGEFILDSAPLTGDVVEVMYMIAGLASGSADTVDGFHASKTPTPNTIPVLNAAAQTGEWWEELGRSSTPVGNILTVPIVQKKYMKVLFRVFNENTTLSSLFLRINGNATAGRYFFNYLGAPNTNNTNVVNTFTAPNTTGSHLMALDSVGQFDVVSGEATIAVSLAGGEFRGSGVISNLARSRNYLMFGATSANWPATSITLHLEAGGTLSGELVVLGHD